VTIGLGIKGVGVDETPAWMNVHALGKQISASINNIICHELFFKRHPPDPTMLLNNDITAPDPLKHLHMVGFNNSNLTGFFRSRINRQVFHETCQVFKDRCWHTMPG
jgi:hypothetical protein